MRDYENVRKRLLFYAQNAVNDDVTKDLTDVADAIEELLATVNHLESCIDQALDALDRGADNDWARDVLEKATQFPEPPKEAE